MIKQGAERFYALLPALYRQRDMHHGEPLRALIAVLESEFRTLETDVEALYDNWFIQTCDTWVLPYIADLVGIPEMSSQRWIFTTQRRQVANTIAYRRRKGTLSTLEHVLKDVTGWHVRVVECSQRIAATQHIAHVRPARGETVDLRRSYGRSGGEITGHTLDHTVDVRFNPDSIGNEGAQPLFQPGSYNAAHLGLRCYRLRSYAMRGSPACEVSAHPEPGYSCYTFHPLGRDMQLFNQPQPLADIRQRFEEAHVPTPISREMLAADLAWYEHDYHDRIVTEQPANSRFYGPQRGLNITDSRRGKAVQIPPMAVVSMDLSGWHTPLTYRICDEYLRQGKCAAIDPQLGRLVLFPPANAPESSVPTRSCDVVVTYSYGFSTEIGGGTYRREIVLEQAECHIGVAKGTRIDTLEKALVVWNNYCETNQAAPRGIIHFLDNGVYDGNAEVLLPPGASLTILADSGVRPILGPACALTVVCVGPSADITQVRRLQLDGLFIDGSVCITERENPAQRLGRLAVALHHCTIMHAGLRVELQEQSAKAVKLEIDHSIIGPLSLPSTMEGVQIHDAIIDSGTGIAIAGSGIEPFAPLLDLQSVTVFGQIYAEDLQARDSIITGKVTVTGRQAIGLVESSYVPPGSLLAQRQHALPEQSPIAPPAFTSTRFGNPAYGQLSSRCPNNIRRGASDGSELGAFHRLHQPDAENNILRVLDEYLPFGFTPSVHYVT
jgi:phage tail-like protein